MTQKKHTHLAFSHLYYMLLRISSHMWSIFRNELFKRQMNNTWVVMIVYVEHGLLIEARGDAAHL